MTRIPLEMKPGAAAQETETAERGAPCRRASLRSRAARRGQRAQSVPAQRMGRRKVRCLESMSACHSEGPLTFAGTL